MSGSATPGAQSLLSFLAPESNEVDPDVVAAALAYASNYAPWCLPQYKQDEAVALFAAHMLKLRSAGYGDGTGVSGEAALSQSQKEGDAQITQFSPAALGLDATALGDYYSRWLAMYKICASCSIVTRFGTR